MTLADIIATITTIPVEAEGKTVTVFKSTHYYHPHALETKATADKAKRIFAAPTLTSLINQTVVSEEQKSYCLSHDFSFYGTGWQSWGFGGETNCVKISERFFAPYSTIQELHHHARRFSGISAQTKQAAHRTVHHLLQMGQHLSCCRINWQQSYFTECRFLSSSGRIYYK